MKVLDVRWFSGQSCVGIVRVEDPYEGIKYYIGSATGMNEDIDKEHISAWGSTFPTEVGDVLFDVDPVKNGTAVPVPVNREQAETMVRVGSFWLNQIDNVTL